MEGLRVWGSMHGQEPGEARPKTCYVFTVDFFKFVCTWQLIIYPVIYVSCSIVLVFNSTIVIEFSLFYQSHIFAYDIRPH